MIFSGWAVVGGRQHREAEEHGEIEAEHAALLPSQAVVVSGSPHAVRVMPSESSKTR